jgi:hypothetical protein
MINDDIIKEFEATKEYNDWQESLLAIMGYATDEELNDEELAGALMADHLNTSLELQKGLERARYEAEKRLNGNFQVENIVE